MYCTNCGSYLANDHVFCMHCGTPRPILPPTKKGTRWIPILIMVLVFTFGCAVYYFSLYSQPLG